MNSSSDRPKIGRHYISLVGTFYLLERKRRRQCQWEIYMYLAWSQLVGILLFLGEILTRMCACGLEARRSDGQADVVYGLVASH